MAYDFTVCHTILPYEHTILVHIIVCSYDKIVCRTIYSGNIAGNYRMAYDIRMSYRNNRRMAYDFPIIYRMAYDNDICHLNVRRMAYDP
jgi:hypothetical protein